jgi:hypothetical protein
VSESRVEPPEFFIDRSLGRYRLAAELRDAGWLVRTMAEVYGEVPGQGLDDPPWLEECGTRGWVALTKDKSILRKQPGGRLSPQLEAIRAGRVCVFVLMNQDLSGGDQAATYRRHERKIMNIVDSRPGPWVYGIYPTGLVEVWPARRWPRATRA